MDRTFAIRAADDLLDAEFTARWRDRQALDPLARAVLGTILERFVAAGGPVAIHDVQAFLGQHPPGSVTEAIMRLDDMDLVLVEGAQVTLAYPFATGPTPFLVVLPDGRERYAVCAIDALGIAPMLDLAVTLRSRCHHCGQALEFVVRPDGPVGGDGMVWVGERDVQQKACTSLCTTLNFFASDAHLAAWHRGNPDVRGAAAVLDEAFRLGATIFGELLRGLILGGPGHAAAGPDRWSDLSSGGVGPAVRPP